MLIYRQLILFQSSISLNAAVLGFTWSASRSLQYLTEDVIYFK